MAYNDLTTEEISVGKPNSNTALTKVKDNFSNHESRIQTLEAGGAVAYPPIIFRVNGLYGQTGAINGIVKTIPNFAITITGIRLYIDTAGSAGTTTIDIKVSHLGGAYTSVLTTLPSVAFGVGNDGVSTNAVLDATKVNISAGDIIRLDLTTVQTAGKSFEVRIDYNKT